jgi:hypothetical protein
MLTIALSTLFVIAYLFWLAQAKFKIIENQKINTGRQYSNGSPVYIEYEKIKKWDGVNSSTVVGSGAGTGVMLNVTK